MPVTQLFDLWGLFVETVFGSVWLSYLGLVVIFSIMSFLFRMSLMLLFYILMLFTIAFMSGYLGDIFLFPALVFSILYFSYSVIRYFGGTGPIAN